VSVIFLFALCNTKEKEEDDEDEDDYRKDLEDFNGGQHAHDRDVKLHEQDGSDSSSVSSDSDNNGGFEYI